MYEWKSKTFIKIVSGGSGISKKHTGIDINFKSQHYSYFYFYIVLIKKSASHMIIKNLKNEEGNKTECPRLIWYNKKKLACAVQCKY